ncbi:MAG: L-threonylcarbamoyladenylate synthase [Syntrophomonas sp.]
MKTHYLRIDPENPDLNVIKKAVHYLNQEELVVFPTETVYGVGALVQSPAAVGKIFAAKERPPKSPLLVHISRFEQALDMVLTFPPEARRLAEACWPGPLSLILPARASVPEIVRGGSPTVGLRMPSHPVARLLIDFSGPLAATSANLSGRPSPVTVDDVKADLDERVSVVLDSGPTGSGLESTVLDLSSPNYCLLRLGGVTVEEIEDLLEKKVRVVAQSQAETEHYKIGIPVLTSKNEEEFLTLLHKLVESGGRVGIVYNDYMPEPSIDPKTAGNITTYNVSLKKGSSGIYTILRQAEQQNLNTLLFTPLPYNPGGIALSIIDRIYAAAAANRPGP